MKNKIKEDNAAGMGKIDDKFSSASDVLEQEYRIQQKAIERSHRRHVVFTRPGQRQGNKRKESTVAEGVAGQAGSDQE